MRSYWEYIVDILNGIIAHLHQALLNTIAFRNLQWSASVMCIIHHHNKFRPFHFFEWLVTCNDLFHKYLLELLLTCLIWNWSSDAKLRPHTATQDFQNFQNFETSTSLRDFPEVTHVTGVSIVTWHNTRFFGDASCMMHVQQCAKKPFGPTFDQSLAFLLA